jgi:hypothetical protein
MHRFPEIDALAGVELEAPERNRLTHDLVRLAAAAAAHLRELHYLGPPFDVRLELSDNDRRLTLVGTPEPANDATNRGEIRDRVASAIREGRLEEIIWDNSAVRESLKFLSASVPSLEIGYHVLPGAHRFTALLEIGGRHPDGLIAALGPLFRSRPTAPVHELDPKALKLLRLLLKTRVALSSEAS